MPFLRIFLQVLLLVTPLWGRTYRIATTPWMGWAFLDVAEARGFWKARGLDVRLQAYPDGASYLDAQLSGEADFACAMVADVVWIHTHREPIRILLETDWSSGGDRVFVRKGKTSAQLEMGPMGYYQARYSLPFFLHRVLPREWRFLLKVPVAELAPSDLAAQFRAGRLDAGVICDPFSAALGPEARILASSADSPGCIPECLFGSRQVVESMSEAERLALVEGVREAMDWMRKPANRPQLMKIVSARSFRSTPFDGYRDMVTQMEVAPVHSERLLLARNAPGGGLEHFLAELKRFLLTYDSRGARFREAELFDARWTRQILTRRGGRRP
nr:ABC transporter substrate-binding protein [uncultured Holophaga sp.]